MSQAITLAEYRQQLTDPNYATGVIIGNNPEDVADRLNNMGFNVSNPQDIGNALNALLERGQYDQFVEALSVSVRTDRMSPQEVVIVTQQGNAMLQTSGPAAKSKAFDANAAFAGLATGVLTYLSATGSTTVAPSTAGGNTPPKPEADNTGLWIGIGVAVVAVVLVVLFLMKKK